uniref:Secretory carrier-associated membrane protein n=1 Tax=Sinocyclocheilus rhinocerous TaxID=307959 RepID=A0A673JSK2_9TELE
FNIDNNQKCFLSSKSDQVRAQAELLRRQEELERKAAELDRREREMQSLSASGGRKNNWPPLPEKFPVGPCFYHDISVDIPVEYQKTIKIMYYLWMFHTGTLFANIFGCLSWFCVDASRGVDFGLAMLWFMLFTPCSFVCWYRPLYGAFRSDSSFRFFVFFFIYICQFGVHVLQAIGITGWGASGWISALTGLNTSIPVGIIMILIAALFTASAVISLIMFKKVLHLKQFLCCPGSLQRADLIGPENSDSAHATLTPPSAFLRTVFTANHQL